MYFIIAYTQLSDQIDNYFSKKVKQRTDDYHYTFCLRINQEELQEYYTFINLYCFNSSLHILTAKSLMCSLFTEINTSARVPI